MGETCTQRGRQKREMKRWDELSRILSVLVLANQLRVVRGLLLVDAGKAGGNGEHAPLVPRSMRHALSLWRVSRHPSNRTGAVVSGCAVLLACDGAHCTVGDVRSRATTPRLFRWT
jgi:hypothetical protein